MLMATVTATRVPSGATRRHASGAVVSRAAATVPASCARSEDVSVSITPTAASAAASATSRIGGRRGMRICGT
jgi:hypothetical protein